MFALVPSVKPDTDWLVIGGGVHGTYLSNVLSRGGGSVRVLDPSPKPLASFFRCADATGMRYLRSPGVHHLDLHPYALRRFAKRGAGKRLARFAFPYDRPELAFFRAHTEHVVEANGLLALREVGRALRLRRAQAGFEVETDRGVLRGRRVVLALGLGEQLCRPAWASAPELEGAVEHIFAPGFSRDALATARRVAVVGGGISAAQLATALAAGGTQVTVVSRHGVRVERFDSDPAWLGPKAMRGFQATSDLDARRRDIADARHRGSMPPEVAADLRREVRAGKITWVEAEVTRATAADGAVSLALDRAPGAVVADRVVLATGFDAHRPGGAMVDDAIAELGLPCARCGYPIVSPQLEWAPGLFVTGPLAELELGPTARNIAGARAAGERLRRVA